MAALYQLRRLKVGCDSRTPSSASFDEETVLLKETTRIGRNPEAVDVVLNSAVHGNMISRLHSIIELKQEKGQQTYVLNDRSLNGTYINDYRAKGPTELKVGDVIKFGHINGAAIKAGCHGPQHSAEFTFIFEKAPPDRLMDRNRPITILGNPRIPDASALSSQVLAADARGLHASSGFPLPSTSVDFPPWQNPGGSASAAAAPFYNLSRFPGYYQFPQINPAYLQSLWPQSPWQSSAAAQQLQQHQLQQQHQKQQQHTLMQSNSVETPWISASMQPDLSNPSAAVPGSSFHPPAAQQASQTQPLTASRPVNVGAAQNSTAVPGFPSNFAPTMMPASANLLSSFQSMYQQQQPSTSVASGITGNSNSAALAAANFPLASAAGAAPSQFTMPFSSTANIPSASSVANVKRMECDSSVPSPPKTQHQPQQNSATAFPQRATTSTAVIGESKPTPSSNFIASLAKPAGTVNSVVPPERIKEEPVKSSPIEAIVPKDFQKESPAAPAPGPSTPPVVPPPAEVIEHKEPKSKVEDDEVSSHRSSPLSNHKEEEEEEEDDDDEEDEEEDEAGSPQKSWKEPSRSRSPSHHSPKRRGHGHSESSRSMSPVPAASTPEVTVKKYKKSNEVARLLNDLTEGAWMNLAGRSGNRHGAPSSHDRDKNGNAEESSEEESSEESEEEEDDDEKKPKKKPASQAKTPASTTEGEKPKRGRPKGSGKKPPVKKPAPRGRKPKQESDSGAESSDSEESESSERSRPKKVGKPSNVSREESRSTPAKRGKKPATPAQTSSTPRKRGRPPVRPPPSSESDSDATSSSSSSSVSSFNPHHGRVTTPKQRKVGTAPSTSTRRGGYGGRGGKASTGRQRPGKRVGRPPASEKRVMAKRKKKNSSSTPESASDATSSDDDDEAPSRRSLDRSAFHNPEEQCGAKSRCQMPQGTNVDWIQCDSCDVWFHRDCVTVDVDEDSEFHCGCKKVGKKRGRKPGY